MWRRLADWHRGWEDELFGVLEQPGHAAVAQSGLRRCLAGKIAKLSAVERRQLRAFAETHRGVRGWWFIAKLLILFSLGGVLWHFLTPGLGWVATVCLANLIGLSLIVAVFSSWYNYRQMIDRRWRLLRQVLLYGAGSALAAAAVRIWVMGQPAEVVLHGLPKYVGAVMLGGLVALLPQMVVSLLRYRQYELLTAQLQREAENDKLARELAESQLRLLRAQIEPHFLFNTLGAVQQLAQHGAPRAAELTANLIDFLRSSMRDMRSEQVSLAAEFGLVESYLKVMQVRLGARLHFDLRLPRALEPVEVPSMILLTLVENAIKHGIEPALRGGEITVSAEAVDGAVRIRVRDSGVGMSTLPALDPCADGGGTGLDNVRRRLRLACGETAALTLRDGDPGLVADVTIPHPEP
jgi:sensor histidine kinase YesM